jgi:hypothetical protein
MFNSSLVPNSRCKPEDCKAFPGQLEKDYMRKYYMHNLTKSIPSSLPIPADVINFIVHYIEEGYNVGDHIEALDTSKKWYFATVIEVEDGHVKVHYENWDYRWDAWLPVGSERIAPVLTHTNGKPYEPPASWSFDTSN